MESLIVAAASTNNLIGEPMASDPEYGNMAPTTS